MAKMIDNSYGKSGVRLLKVVRGADRHEIIEYTVDILLNGDFETVHTKGDNSKVLPTDTMKNTVYVMAKKHDFKTAEEFGKILSHHFVGSQPHISRARITITERPWQRMNTKGSPDPHAFSQAVGERHTTFVDYNGKSTSFKAGLKDLIILKSTNSGFSGYIKDDYTTLGETDDRVFATSLTATWSYNTTEADFAATRKNLRTRLLELFAEHHSLSVQHTLYEMGEKVLEEFPHVEDIHMTMPNKHFLKFNLEPFGLENENEIFYPIEEPYGLIDAKLAR